MKKWTGFLILSIFACQLFSQNPFISGTITSRETTQAIENISITATNTADTGQYFQTTTNEYGHYEIPNFFTGIAALPLAFKENLAVFEKNGLLQITVVSQQNITQATAYNSWGKVIAQIPLQKISTATYVGNLYKNFSKQLLIIQAGNQAIKHMAGFNLSTNVSPTYNRLLTGNNIFTDQRSATHNQLKSTTLETFNLRFQITHPDTLFQPIDTIIYALDTALQNTINFEMHSWPTFQAQISTALLMPEPVPGALIVFTNLADTTQKDTMENVHPESGMYFLSLPIPATDTNWLLPDTLLFSVTTQTGGFDCTTDTLKLSQGEYNYAPDCWLNPANVYASMQITLLDSLTHDSLPHVTVLLSNAANNLLDTSNASGHVFFDSITLPLYMPEDNPYYEVEIWCDGDSVYQKMLHKTITNTNYYDTIFLHKKYTYRFFGNTNAQQIQLTGEGIDSLINITGNSYASNTYDSRDANKIINLLGSAWGYQDKDTNIVGSGNHEVDIVLDPNVFGLQGSINESEVELKFITGEDTVQNLFNYNYTFSKQQVTDSLDVKVLGTKNWFNDLDTTLRLASGNNTYNITMVQNRWPFSFGGEGNVPVHVEDDQGRNLGIITPVDNYWNLNIDTTVNSFNIHVYTNEADRYNRDTAFVAVAGVNKEINMVADKKYFYQFSGNSTNGATVEISGNLVDTSFVAGNTFSTPTYESRDSNLVHTITSYLTGYQQKDTTVNKYGNHNLELILEENVFGLQGTSAPSGGYLIVIADPTGSQDTIFNSNFSNSYQTSQTHKAAETIEYRLIANADGYVGIDSIFTKNKGTQTFDFALQEDVNPMKEVIVKTLVKLDGVSKISGARVIYEHSGIRDTAYTLDSGLDYGIAYDTIYTTADLASIKFTRYIEECEQTNFYHFISDTTENITLNEGLNQFIASVSSYPQVEDIEFELVLDDGSPAVGAKGKIEYAAGGVYAESEADANGKIMFTDVPAGLYLLLTAGYDWTTDSTKVAWKDVPYSTPNEVVEENKKRVWHFDLDDKYMHIPGTNTGTAADSVYVSGDKIRSHAGGAANVRNTMGLADQFYFNTTIPQDTITKWIANIEKNYYNNERTIDIVYTPFEHGSNQEFIDFDYITNKDHPELLGWNVSDGANNTVAIQESASNGDIVRKGGTITVAGNESGFIKELVKRGNGITNAANGFDEAEERTSVYYIVNQRQARYEIITQTTKKVPIVKYVVDMYE